MGYVLIVGVIIAAIVLLLAIVTSKTNKGEPELQYRLLPALLSKAELSFYGPLTQAAKAYDVTVFSKVRIADVLAPVKNSDRKIWQRAFNAISSKHFDFVVCSNKDSMILLAVELDDKSHNTQKAQKRDRIVNTACDTAGLPLLRFKTKGGYVVADIRSELDNLLTPGPSKDEMLAVPLKEKPTAETTPVAEPVQPPPEPTPVVKQSTSKMAKAVKLSTSDYIALLVGEGYLLQRNDAYELTDKAILAGAEKKTGQRVGEYFVWPSDLNLRDGPGTR